MFTLTCGCPEVLLWAFMHAAMHYQLIQTMISWRLSKEPTLPNREPPEVSSELLKKDWLYLCERVIGLFPFTTILEMHRLLILWLPYLWR